MKIVNAVIIDDEVHNRNLLNTLLKKHCPNINVIDEADNADDAFEKIKINKPQLVFLDIKMPNKSGFDLLKMFDSIFFEVIFVSGFDEYAITAFEFNALDYILKPIDYLRLIKSVDKAIAKIKPYHQNENVNQFVNTLDEQNDIINKISIHHNKNVILINILDIISVEGNLGFCVVKTVNNEKYNSTKELKLFEAIFEKTGYFIRISKSVIISSNHIKSYSKGDICIIEMVNMDKFEVSRRKKTEVLNAIKTF